MKSIKKFIALFLIILVLTAFVPTNVQAGFWNWVWDFMTHYCPTGGARVGACGC